MTSVQTAAYLAHLVQEELLDNLVDQATPVERALLALQEPIPMPLAMSWNRGRLRADRVHEDRPELKDGQGSRETQDLLGSMVKKALMESLVRKVNLVHRVQTDSKDPRDNLETKDQPQTVISDPDHRVILEILDQSVHLVCLVCLVAMAPLDHQERSDGLENLVNPENKVTPVPKVQLALKAHPATPANAYARMWIRS